MANNTYIRLQLEYCIIYMESLVKIMLCEKLKMYKGQQHGMYVGNNYT